MVGPTIWDVVGWVAILFVLIHTQLLSKWIKALCDLVDVRTYGIKLRLKKLESRVWHLEEDREPGDGPA